MARWHVPDEVGLELIGFPGKIGRSGKRPRFRFSTKQQRTTAYLAQIDAALEAAHMEIIIGWTARFPRRPSHAGHRSSTCSPAAWRVWLICCSP